MALISQFLDLVIPGIVISGAACRSDPFQGIHTVQWRLFAVLFLQPLNQKASDPCHLECGTVLSQQPRPIKAKVRINGWCEITARTIYSPLYFTELIEPRKKKALLSIESWFFNWDPYNGYCQQSPYNCVV